MLAEDIARAVLGVDGVLEIAGGHAKGIRLAHSDGGLVIDINVILRCGIRIPEMAWQLQQLVKKLVTESGAEAPTGINITIRGIRTE
ncbi:MAG: Asp23/Gls24 family envelope stress response protein [Clostridiales Family XIII bacterium]|jgi:uncharacterized alkaline shock family protein YloU|nr:Asp23/Gls24 family envelope stress response protein [Clostridiales Family XIII bacterium]